METILNIASAIDRILWGPWTMVFIAAVAVFFTLKSRLFQIRKFRLIWTNTLGTLFKKAEGKSTKKMTPFQATATALASTVGMGNMAGVANVDRLWVFANISVGVCSIPNLIAILALHGAFYKLMRDYLSRRNEFATAIIDQSKVYIRTPKNEKEDTHENSDH